MEKNSWVLVKVRKGTPVIFSKNVLKNAKTSFGKKGYSFWEEFPCYAHDIAHESCDDCVIKHITYTDKDQLRFAHEHAKKSCSLSEDCWIIDSDTEEIIAAYSLVIQQLK